MYKIDASFQKLSIENQKCDNGDDDDHDDDHDNNDDGDMIAGDTNSIAENWMENNAMKMIRLQFNLAVKTNLINKCRNIGYVQIRFVRYQNSVLLDFLK